MGESGGIWLRVGLAVLATWRAIHLLASQDGPADAFGRLRARLGGGFLGTLMGCFECLSLWIAAPLALWVCAQPLDRLVAWLGLLTGI